jgi:hypothetical protein
MEHPHVRVTQGATTGTYTAGSFPDRAALKSHLRVDFSDDDTYIDNLLLTTVSYIEEYCSVKFGVTTYEAFWDYAYPVVMIGQKFEAVGTNGLSAPTLAQFDDDGIVYTNLASSQFQFDVKQNPIRVYMKGSYGIKSVLNQFRFTFQVQNSNPPKYVYQAALLIAGHFYENRQDVGSDRVFEVPLTSRHLLERYRQSCFA